MKIPCWAVYPEVIDYASDPLGGSFGGYVGAILPERLVSWGRRLREAVACVACLGRTRCLARLILEEWIC